MSEEGRKEYQFIQGPVEGYCSGGYKIPAPHYYTLAKSRDLYSIFIEINGLETWLRHVEMEAIQYLFRARSKGDYLEDIRKVRVICERIIEEVEKSDNTVT